MNADELKRYEAYPELVKVLQLILRADKITNTVEFRVRLADAFGQARGLLKVLGEKAP